MRRATNLRPGERQAAACLPEHAEFKDVKLGKNGDAVWICGLSSR
jgi:hypothetical protein